MATSDLDALSPQKRALLEQRLRRARLSTAPVVPEPARLERRRSAPLSPAQEQLWYFSKLAPDNPVYNEAVSIRKQGSFDARALRASFNEIVRRHEIWRSTFHELDGGPVQIVGPPPVLELPIIDLSQLAMADREVEAGRLVADQARPPYDLERGPLLRPLLIRVSEDHHRLYLAMHHLIFDGASLNSIVLPELVELYDAFSADVSPSLPEPVIQYSDYAIEARAQRHSVAHAVRIRYWRKHLNGASTLQLPLDHQRPARQRFHGGVIPLRISKDLSDRSRSLSRSSEVTLFQVLAAAFAVLLQRYTDQDDIVFGTPTDMRDRPELERMVGYCVTPLVVRIDVREESSFTELLDRIHNVLVDGLSNLTPFERLVRELRLDREPGINPLFQVAMVLQPSTAGVEPAWSLHQMEAAVGNAVGNAKFDLVLELDERPEGHIDGRLVYDRDLFEPDTAARMASHLITILDGGVEAPRRPIAELPLLTEQQRHEQLVDWNATSADYPRDASIHELVTAQARRTPDAVAAVFGGERLSYRELDRRANSLASRVAARNPRRGIVAIYLERSLDMLVGMLAILKSGAAYLPLDVDHPPRRLSGMVQDVEAAVLLTDSRLLPVLPDRPAQVVCIDEDPPEDTNLIVPLARARAEDLACVLYTYGSTNRPNGVCISHRSVVNVLTSLAREPGITADDTMVAVAACASDIAAIELWLPLVTGARVVIAPRDVAADGRRLTALLERSKITIMQATPATWQMMVEAGWPGRAGMVALCSGERLPPELAESLLQRTACVWNMYGRTETTSWSTVDRVESGAPITIGRPLANTRAYILRRGRPVPVGVVGELAIAGDGVAAGYLNRPQLTEERFVPDPFVAGERMYLTGDLARYRADGRIEHLGRLDDQLKIRGFRVEPGEIEAALTAAPDVAAAAVVARGDGPAETRLVAYVVPTGAPSPASELRRRLRITLPSYMVPSVFVNVDALPLSANGKIDRSALPASEGDDGEHRAASAAPRSAAEEKMAAIWSQILGSDELGVHDDFFDLGGHSLLAVRLLTEVVREFGVRLSLAECFDDGVLTVANVTAKLESARTHTASNGAAAGSTVEALPFLFFVNPSELSMASLRHFTGSSYRAVGLLPESADFGSDVQSIEGLASELLDSVRQTQPHGPYHLVGYSLGGLLAYEIAGQLRAAEEEVAWLGVLDTLTPGWLRHELTLRQMVARLRRRGPRWALAKVNEVARSELAVRLSALRRREADTSEQFDMIGAAKLAARYSCTPHDAPLDLFVTESTAFGGGSDSLGWDELHRGPFRVHRIAGDHDGMMRAGPVDTVAEIVSTALKEASGEFGDSRE